MKTCFSTLACPNFTWQEIYSMAKDFGFDGIEIRGLGQDIFSVKAAPFTDKELPKTIAKLKSPTSSAHLSSAYWATETPLPKRRSTTTS